MKKIARLLICAAVSACLVEQAAAQRRGGVAIPEARIDNALANAALTLPSTASPRAVLAQYLRGRGRSESTVQSLVEISRGSGRDSITHARFEQRIGGLPVFGTYARAALNARGELLHLVENLVDVSGGLDRATISPQQAVAAAIANLYPELRTVPAGFFRVTPSATRVAIPYGDGTLAAGFVVQTWTRQGNELHDTLIDGSGSLLDVEPRTSNDSYNVFLINPNVTPQSIGPGPGTGHAESPSGWLFAGAQGSTHIAGNNVSAYLDVMSNNRSDEQGDAVDLVAGRAL